MYKIHEVPSDAADLPEQLGTKFKFWFRLDGVPYLYKEGRTETGEDWAEKAACEICRSLGIPHAEYELASWKQTAGVISKGVVPEGGALRLGNEVLADIDDSYPSKVVFREKLHTVERVVGVLGVDHGILPPQDAPLPEGVTTALDVLVGYLMLDVLIANQDRHHQNWGLVVTATDAIYLAPTFDHASGLGRNESDAVRRERLTTSDSARSVRRYVERARSAFFDSGEPPKRVLTIDAFLHAAAERPVAAAAWLGRLERLSPDIVEGILQNIPPERMSEDALQFAAKIVELNRDRLLASRENLHA